MDLSLNPDETAFRDEVRGWLTANLPDDLRDKVIAGAELTKDDYLRWHKILAAKGWVAPAWPVEWGGTGWDVTRRYIFDEEIGRVGAPQIISFGVVMIANVLLKFGTEAQKARFLPRIYNGDDFWIQGYSEPGAGSDLAALSCRAERRGDSYVINGQKMWQSLGQYGDWMFALVRTSSEGKKQEGISFLLIDMTTPGITVRPLILMDGAHEVNEVFFDDVVVPVENLVFEENKGWTVAKFLLGFERLNTGRIGMTKAMLERLKVFVAAQPDGHGGRLLDDVRFRDALTRLEVELMALELTNLRILDAVRKGRPLGAEVSALKIKSTGIQQRVAELTMQAAGPAALQVRPAGAGDAGAPDPWISNMTLRYANMRKVTIFGGSSEVQRNIYAKMALGMG